MSKAMMELKTNEINVVSWKFDKSKTFFFSDLINGDTVYPSRLTNKNIQKKEEEKSGIWHEALGPPSPFVSNFAGKN